MDLKIVDTDYTAISVLEDMHEIGKWLTEQAYFVVVDEDLNKIGIVTAKDYIHFPHNQVIDCNFNKPYVTKNHTDLEIITLMKESNNVYLPVSDSGCFYGIISLFSMVEKLFGK